MDREFSVVYSSVFLEGFQDINEGRYFQSTGDWKRTRRFLRKKRLKVVGLVQI